MPTFDAWPLRRRLSAPPARSRTGSIAIAARSPVRRTAMTNDPEQNTPSEAEQAEEMEQAQKDAAEERENEGGYQ